MTLGRFEAMEKVSKFGGGRRPGKYRFKTADGSVLPALFEVRLEVPHLGRSVWVSVTDSNDPLTPVLLGWDTISGCIIDRDEGKLWVKDSDRYV